MDLFSFCLRINQLKDLRPRFPNKIDNGGVSKERLPHFSEILAERE